MRNTIGLGLSHSVKIGGSIRRLSFHVDGGGIEMRDGIHETYLNSKSHMFCVFSYLWNLNSDSAPAKYEETKTISLLRSIDPSYNMLKWEILESDTKMIKLLEAESVNTVFDIKYAWEFSRMQHMILQLLGGAFSKEVISEVKCQILDFIINNRPGEGIHWSSPMEVAIRAINFLFASELIDSIEKRKESDEFENILNQSLIEHHQYILEHLEHKSGLGNNHYLSNIVGLLFTAFRFDEEKMNASLLKFADVFVKEVDKQFLDDGVNFESSTTYHAFSLEMSVYGLALIKRLQIDNKLKYDSLNYKQHQNAIEKIFRAYVFLDEITTKDGRLIQFGDNDSARLLKLEPNYILLNTDQYGRNYRQKNHFESEVIPDEDLMNYTPVLNACRSLFGIEHDRSVTGNIIQQITKGSILNIPKLPILSITYNTGMDYVGGLNFKAKSHINIPGISANRSKVFKKLYPYGGIYILECSELRIVINGMNRHVKQYWPHGHNDKLSFEVIINDKSFFRDPGSFTYTGIPTIRNKYRSVKAHNAPQHGKEQNTWIAGAPGVFRMKPRTKVSLLESAANSIALRMTYDDVVHVRSWTIDEGLISIIDYSNKPFETNFFPDIFYSNGYGKMTNTYA
ncbi:MAG: heparinase II/III family protein [Vicingaceae bacterium]